MASIDRLVVPFVPSLSKDRPDPSPTSPTSPTARSPDDETKSLAESGEHETLFVTHLPAVAMGIDVDRMVKHTLLILARADGMYSRDGRPAWVVSRDRVPGQRVRPLDAPLIRFHTDATLRRAMSRSMKFVWVTKRGPETRVDPCAPPPSVVSNVLQDGVLAGFPVLVGVASSPLVRADGTIAQDAGYDRETGYFLAPPEGMARVPEDPSMTDALRALSTLTGLVSDFPWATPADVSAWLALGLTMVCRPAIAGATPLFSVTANTRGAGKSRLVDVMSLLVTGRTAARATQPADEAEAGKLLTSIAVEGDPVVLFDNLSRPFGGAKLDAWLTGDRWKDRLLGRNTTTDLPITTVMAATGNNVSFAGDTARRVMPIRLDSALERPEARQDFKIADLLGHVRAHRLELLAALLTVARAWFAAGRPGEQSVPWGGFESFASTVPPMLVWLGMPDPMATRAAVEEADDSLEAMRVLMEEWRRMEEEAGTRGVSVGEAMGRVYGPDGAVTAGRGRMAEALAELVPARPGSEKVEGKQVGYLIRQWKGRVVDGRRWVAMAATAAGGKRWSVR